MHNQEEILDMIAGEANEPDTHRCQCGCQFNASEDGCLNCGARGNVGIVGEDDSDYAMNEKPVE